MSSVKLSPALKHLLTLNRPGPLNAVNPTKLRAIFEKTLAEKKVKASVTADIDGFLAQKAARPPDDDHFAKAGVNWCDFIPLKLPKMLTFCST